LPSTRGEDGDPLDALVIHDAPTSTGLVIRCRIVGALKVKQTVKGRNERNGRFFAVPECDPEAHLLQDIRNWAKEMRGQMEQFFCASVAREDKELAFLGWAGPKEALKLIKADEQALTKALIKS
jgi:inorganic pyrophosphatase